MLGSAVLDSYLRSSGVVSSLARPRTFYLLLAGLLLLICRSAEAVSPLYDAVTRNDVRSVQTAILAGEDVNAPQEFGRTALHEAARSGHSQVMRLLLNSGAEIDARNPSGLTPLHLAAIWGHRGAAELLLANCADVEATNVDRSMPLHLAVAADHADVAALLLANGAPVNAERRGRVTPLRVALNYRHWELADLLRSRAGLVDAARVGALEGRLPAVGTVPPAGVEPARDLATARRGSVEQVQELLTELDYTPGPIDGALGARTIESIRDFQAQIGQVVTGSISDCLISRLEARVRQTRDVAPDGVDLSDPAVPEPGEARSRVRIP